MENTDHIIFIPPLAEFYKLRYQKIIKLYRPVIILSIWTICVQHYHVLNDQRPPDAARAPVIRHFISVLTVNIELCVLVFCRLSSRTDFIFINIIIYEY